MTDEDLHQLVSALGRIMPYIADAAAARGETLPGDVASAIRTVERIAKTPRNSDTPPAAKPSGGVV